MLVGGSSVCVWGFFSVWPTCRDPGHWHCRQGRGLWVHMQLLCEQQHLFRGLKIHGNSVGFKFPGSFTRVWPRVTISDEAVSSEICLLKNKPLSPESQLCSLLLLRHLEGHLYSWPFLLCILCTFLCLAQMFFGWILTVWMTFQLKWKRKSLFRRNIYLCCKWVGGVTCKLIEKRHSESLGDLKNLYLIYIWVHENVCSKPHPLSRCYQLPQPQVSQ